MDNLVKCQLYFFITSENRVVFVVSDFWKGKKYYFYLTQSLALRSKGNNSNIFPREVKRLQAAQRGWILKRCAQKTFLLQLIFSTYMKFLRTRTYCLMWRFLRWHGVSVYVIQYTVVNALSTCTVEWLCIHCQWRAFCQH